MFGDRKAIIKEDSPNGEWSLHIYGPTSAGPQDEPPFYASFMKKSKETITALPFGYPADPAAVRVVWHETGRQICQIFIDQDCYVMFLWGTWRAYKRGFFRLAPESPFSPEDFATMEHQGYLKGDRVAKAEG